MPQQDAGSEHVDSYPGLRGKGLCARALYDYQAGNVLRSRRYTVKGQASEAPSG